MTLVDSSVLTRRLTIQSKMAAVGSYSNIATHFQHKGCTVIGDNVPNRVGAFHLFVGLHKIIQRVVVQLEERIIVDPVWKYHEFLVHGRIRVKDQIGSFGMFLRLGGQQQMSTVDLQVCFIDSRSVAQLSDLIRRDSDNLLFSQMRGTTRLAGARAVAIRDTTHATWRVVNIGLRNGEGVGQ